MFQSPLHSVRPDFARVISRKFERGRFLVIGAEPEKLERQFGETGREAVVCERSADLTAKLHDSGTPRFEIAVWLYPAEKSGDERVVEELARAADEIVLIPGAEADVAKRRPQLVEAFRRFGLLPNYGCDLDEVDPGALCLRRQSSETAATLVPSVEAAFARLNRQISGLHRILRTRISELDAADRHIAALEEKLLKLKEYRRELKILKEQRQALRKSPERRVGQILLGPYRIPEKLVQAVWKRVRPRTARRKRSAAQTDYQKWLERHRANAGDLDQMRHEAHAFADQPLISVITPVFNTPVSRLEEAVESVLAQAYEKWELLLIDDGSSAADLLQALPDVAGRDQRIVFTTLAKHEGISAASNQGLAFARGEWIVFLDHDDVLEPDAFFQIVKLLQTHPDAGLIYSDEDKLTEDGCEAPLFKPDWSPDFFLSYNYVGHLTAVRRDIIQKAGGFRSQFDSAQDYDLFFRVIEQTNQIHHIPRILYHWRRSAESSAISVRQKPGQLEASRLAIEDHLKRRGERAYVAVDWRTHAFCIRRELLEARKISIVIPAYRGLAMVAPWIESLTSKTDYPDYEIVIVDDKNDHPDSQPCLSRIPHRLLHFPSVSNVSTLKNLAVAQTDGPWILFLEDNIEVIGNDWLMLMAEHVQRPDVGAVGAQLLNPDDTIEHAGIVLGVNGIAQPAFRGFPAEHPGPNRQLQVTRNCSAISSACMLMRREVFQELGGLDESLPDAFADIDFCLRMRQADYLIVYTPFAKLCHRGPEDGKMEPGGEAIMRERWSGILEQDPYYNPNLSHERADFSLGE